MARQPRPWFREFTGWWMVTLGGKQVKLAEGKANEKLATLEFHKLMVTAAEAPGSPDLRVVSVCDLYLESAERRLKRRTYENELWYLQRFCEACGEIRVSDLKPHHLNQWVEAQVGWTSSDTRYNAVARVKRVFSWAVDNGYISKSPLAAVKRPARSPRRYYLRDDVYRAIRRAARPELKYLVFALRQTGARPEELYGLVWDQVHGDRIVLTEHKSAHQTGGVRIIFLNNLMQRVLAKLRGQSRSCFVFTNTRGDRWNSNSVQNALNRLKRKLNIKVPVFPYALRHAFATYALKSGLNTATVAQLMGHADATMVSRVYGHLAQEEGHLKSAAEAALGRGSKRRPD